MWSCRAPHLVTVRATPGSHCEHWGWQELSLVGAVYYRYPRGHTCGCSQKEEAGKRACRAQAACCGVYTPLLWSTQQFLLSCLAVSQTAGFRRGKFSCLCFAFLWCLSFEWLVSLGAQGLQPMPGEAVGALGKQGEAWEQPARQRQAAWLFLKKGDLGRGCSGKHRPYRDGTVRENSRSCQDTEHKRKRMVCLGFQAFSSRAGTCSAAGRWVGWELVCSPSTDSPVQPAQAFSANTALLGALTVTVSLYSPHPYISVQLAECTEDSGRGA